MQRAESREQLHGKRGEKIDQDRWPLARKKKKKAGGPNDRWLDSDFGRTVAAGAPSGPPLLRGRGSLRAARSSALCARAGCWPAFRRGAGQRALSEVVNARRTVRRAPHAASNEGQGGAGWTAGSLDGGPIAQPAQFNVN